MASHLKTSQNIRQSGGCPFQESGKAALSIDFNTIVQKLNELEKENETKHIYDEPRQKRIFDFKKRVEKKYDC